MTRDRESPHAEIAALKRTLGAGLTDGERKALEEFERTESGRQFVREVRGVCKDLARLRESRRAMTDSEDFARRVQAQVQREARDFRRRFLSFCLVTVGMAAAVGALPLLFGGLGKPPGRVHDLWILLGAFVLGVCGLMWTRTSRLLRADDALSFLRRQESRRAPILQRILNWGVIVLLTVLLARDWGWGLTLLVVGLVGVVMRYLAGRINAVIRSRRQKEDPEAWSWWYGEEDR